MAENYVNWGNPLTAPDRSEEDPTWGDYGKALGSGAVSIGTGAGALAEYAGDALGSESLTELGRSVRDLGNTVNDRVIESMTEPAQRALGASFLPGEDDDSAYDDLGSSLGLKITAALPSLIASVVPGGVAARAYGTLAGTIAGSGAGAAINAGDVANTIYSEFDKQSDDELRASNPMYDAYRLGGMDEKEARAAVRKDVIGYAPALAFVFTAATSKFGPEGAVARIFGGDAKEGAVRGLMRGYLGEAGQEGSEGFFNEYLQGNAAATGGYGEFDQSKAWEQALEGALIGGILGAPFGAVEGMAGRSKPRVDPNADTTTQGASPPEDLQGGNVQQAPLVGPDVTQAAATTAAQTTTTTPSAPPSVGPKGRRAKSSKKATEAAPPVQEVPVGGLSAEEQAAAVTAQDNQTVSLSNEQQARQLINDLMPAQAAAQLIGARDSLGLTDTQAQAPQAPTDQLDLSTNPLVQRLAQIRQEAQQLAQELPQVPKAQAPAPAVDPVPEQTQTIDAQREQLVNGERKAVLYTPNQPVPPELPGMKRIKVKDQIWDYNPAQTTAKDIRAAVKAKRENEILDLGSVAKQDLPAGAPEVAVVARDNTGVETRAAVGTPDTAPQQLAEMQDTQKSNEAQIAIEPADQVIVERLQNPPKAVKAKETSKARTPVKAPDIVIVPTGETKIGPEGRKIIEVESAVAKQQREAAMAETEEDADKNDVDMTRGNRDAGVERQVMSDRKSRERFFTRVETELKKGDNAAPWAKQADAVRKKYGDKLGRGKKAPAGYYDALQAAHDAEVSTRAVEPAPEKPLTKKEAAKQATAEKRAAEAAKTAEEKAAELENEISESKTLSMKNKATLRAILANDKQTMAERVETAQLAMKGFADDAAAKMGFAQEDAMGSGSKNGDRGLSIDTAREEGFDIVEVLDNIDDTPDGLLAGDIGELTATEDDVLAAAKSLEETYETKQEPITRERPTVELAEGEGFTAVTETKPVNKVDNPLAQLKPKVSGKISLNRTVKPVAVTGERSNLRGNQRQSFSIESSGQIITPLQSTTVGAMLDRLNFDHLNGLARVLAPKLRKALRQSAANVQLHIVDETQMRAVDPTNPRGFYLHSGHVFIRADQLAENGAAYAIMHEAVHAAFLNAMRSKPAIAKMVERMRKATLDHHFGGDQMLGEGLYYGFENADEFLAEAMSNPDFQDLLAQTPMPEAMALELGFDKGSRFSLWNAMVEMIRRALGLGNSDRVMLEGVMRIGQKLEAVAARANAQTNNNLEGSVSRAIDQATQNFKRWFGKSKIVNADGSPKVMYHGTSNDFSTFNRGRKGIFVTDNPKFADGFTGASRLEELIDANGPDAPVNPNLRPNIMPVYVRAENPFDFEDQAQMDRLAESLKEAWWRPDDRAYFERELLPRLRKGEWDYIEMDRVQDVLKQFGHDGYYVMEKGQKNLAVYSPNQLKSATGNNGDYSITDDNITRLRGSDITSEVKTRAKVAGEGLTGIAIKTMTLDFMRQKFGGLFNGAFDRYVEAVQQRDNIVNTVADLHDKDAAEFIELMRRNPDEGVAMADLAMDATRLDVNLGPNANNSHLGKNSKKGLQARKRIGELQARYDALQPETQELMQRMTEHYRETHNANVTALAYNVLSELPVKLSNSDLMQLLDKVTSGTLTDQDAKTVGDPTIFNSLRRSTELKTIKGMYFPNMRFGDHVVLTREKVTAPNIKKVELRGGKLANVRTELVGDNTVRFIGDPSIRGVSTALMRLADDFVAKSDLPLVAYRKRSMDRTTGEVVSASEERSDREYDVVYEVELRNQGVHFFDSATDAEKFRASSTSAKTSQVLDRRADQVQQMISSSALSNVVKAIEARKDLPEVRRKQMRNVLEAAIVANLPGNRAEARYQARRNVKGASKDVGRAALAYGRAAGNFQATLQTAPAQREALREMTEIEDATKFGDNAATISKVMNEVRAREAVIEGPLGQNKFFQDVATLSFFDKLVSPAYNIVNFQQVIMNSLPVLGGRYGLWRTNSAIMAAYKRVGTLETILSGVKNTASAAAQWNRTSIDTTDLLGSIRKNLGPKYEPLVEMLIKRGAISPDIGMEIGAALSEGRGAWGQGLSKFDRIARQLPGAVEAVNRMVSAVATYDLAVASGKSHQAAMQEAFDITLNTQGDYRRSNSPRFMNDGKLAWALQFKKFAVLQTQLMGDMFYRAMKDASPEERAIARKQLAIMVGVQVMYAGALGLPGLELAKLVFTMGAALGLSDGWEDQERRIKQILADSIGKTPAELLTSGVVSRAIGIDVSKRMSQADLWTGFAPKAYDARGLTEYVGTAILGAPGATVFDWFDASKALAKGDVLKTLELAVPVKTFADTATAVRKYQEGKYSPTDAALKVIGFTSARQARISEETGNRIKDRKKAKTQQDELVKSYLNARSAADRVKAKSKIREFNKNVPEGGRKISINGLDRILEEQRQIYATQ